MLDIASFGNGLVGPGREVNDPPPGRLAPVSPARPGDRLSDGSGIRTLPSIDRVEVSEHASLMARLNQVPEVRWERVDSARVAIQGKDYIDQHIDEAIDRLLAEF